MTTIEQLIYYFGVSEDRADLLVRNNKGLSAEEIADINGIEELDIYEEIGHDKD